MKHDKMSLEDLLLNQIHLQISRWFVQQDVWLSKKLISKFDLSFFRYESRGMTIDVEAELARYRGLSTKIRPFVTETGTSNSKQWIFSQLTTERFSGVSIVFYFFRSITYAQFLEWGQECSGRGCQCLNAWHRFWNLSVSQVYASSTYSMTKSCG